MSGDKLNRFPNVQPSFTNRQNPCIRYFAQAGQDASTIPLGANASQVSDTSPMPSSKPTVVDLFAGAGLFSAAFKSCGFRITRAIELDRVAAATYARNVGRHIEVGDVAQIVPTGDCEVLIAGPPCQGFSTLGARRKDDPRNQLSLQVVRWAKVLRPRAIVIENVASFLLSEVYSKLVQQLRQIGFFVSAEVLDAADFGVAQYRRRCFIVACAGVNRFAFPKPARQKKTVRAAFEGLSVRPNGRNQHIAPEPSPTALARMKVIPTGGDKRDVVRLSPHLAPPSWFRTTSEVTDVWGRMFWDQPSNTLRTCLQNASKGRYIHPEQNRVISIREAARLHSIPDSWTFEGLPTHIARQIGNGVPPRLGRTVARSLRSIL